jgi:tRNA dimethylallyltransferase
MFETGLIEETRTVVAAGRRPALERLRAVGYDEALAVVDGRLVPAEAEARVNQRTRQLAKRQRTWFRHQLARVPTVRLESEGTTLPDLVQDVLGLLR